METAKEIKQHLRNGDFNKVAKLAGVTREYAIILLGRPTARRYKAVLKAARKVAKANLKMGL
ncbi:hypothetical protein [Fibrella forsythiae]|uniref:Transcriptional regulator n=1 Tax=Fibrella forsythiae TaxID=2817061 RepID=A0ABS3JSZ0_9BACT|nr:hypothetical protein [Fibrella forsythiae]MBO0953124.1 hypothetical protein [Fibrella forsythiae]